MSDENKAQGPLSVFDAAEALMEPKGQPTEEIAEVEAEDDESEVEDDAEEVSEEVEAEAEDTEDDPDEDSDDEAEPEDDDLYEVGGETFTLSELREWKSAGLRQADYTKKTQELSEARKAWESERQTFEAERQQVVAHLKQESERLRDALATFAIDAEQEPDWANMDPAKYPRERAAWDAKQKKKAEAQQQYQMLMAQQHQDTVRRELDNLYRVLPEWRDPAVFQAEASAIKTLGAEYGFAPDEMDQIVDHRMFRVLNELKRLKALENSEDTRKKADAKKVAKAAKRLPASAKPAKNLSEKQARQKKLDRVKRTGSLHDAAAYIMEG